MKIIFLKAVLIFVLLMSGVLYIFSGQEKIILSNSGKTGKYTKLTLNISNIECDTGFVRIHLYNYERKDFFPKKTKNCFQHQVVKIENGRCTVIFPNLPNDSYCLSVHHDENSNEKMDTNFLGLPTEGWGISNNVKLFMRLPDFDECSFQLDGKDTSINVEMRY